MLGGDLPAARPAEQASAWREALHPRHQAGTSKGGEFAPKGGGRAASRTAPNGKKVWVAQLTPEQRAANLDALKAAKTVKVEGVTRLTIPGGVTTQEIPRQWLVDNGYAIPSSRGRLYGGDGVIQLKRDVDQEAILVHYLSGKKPENYPVGTKGFDQFMYGRNLPAGASKEVREAMRKLRGKNKAEREAIVRRITAALVAAGIEEMEAHALVAAAFVESKHRRHPKGSERGGEFAPKTGLPTQRTALDVQKPNRARVMDEGQRQREHAKAMQRAERMRILHRSYDEMMDIRAARPRPPATATEAPPRAWAPGTTMGELEDALRGNPSDEELGRIVRALYEQRTQELRKVSGI